MCQASMAGAYESQYACMIKSGLRPIGRGKQRPD
jgi:hypothetical protein